MAVAATEDTRTEQLPRRGMESGAQNVSPLSTASQAGVKAPALLNRLNTQGALSTDEEHAAGFFDPSVPVKGNAGDIRKAAPFERLDNGGNGIPSLEKSNNAWTIPIPR